MDWGKAEGDKEVEGEVCGRGCISGGGLLMLERGKHKIKTLGRCWRFLPLGLNDRLAMHIWLQNLWNTDSPIWVLIIFQNSDKGSSNG